MRKKSKEDQIDDLRFWNVVYSDLSCVSKLDKHIKGYTSFDRYREVYPYSNSDIKVYEADSNLGLEFAKVVAEHYDLDIIIKSERVCNSQLKYAIIKIPEAIMDTLYNNDYEE